VTLLAAETFDLADGHALDADFAKGIFDFLEFEWFYNCFDFFHLRWGLRIFILRNRSNSQPDSAVARACALGTYALAVPNRVLVMPDGF